MTSPTEALRARLVNVLMDDDTVAGSLYLRALCCVWLACPGSGADDSELEGQFLRQAEEEGVDGDEILNALIVLVDEEGPQCPS